MSFELRPAERAGSPYGYGEVAMVTLELKGLKEAMAAVDSRSVKLAARAALDRTAKAGRTVVSEEIRAIYNVKKSDLDPRIKINPPRANNLMAKITIDGKGMSLSFFGAKQVTASATVTRAKGNSMTSKALFVGPTRGRRKALPVGVTVQVLKGKSATPLKSSFMTKMKSGHIGVMRRVGKKRLPINEQKVISLATMATNAKVLPNMLKKIQERWGVEFPRQLEYYRTK